MNHIHVENLFWIRVYSEEALEMGFKKASANYDFSKLGLPIDRRICVPTIFTTKN